MQIQLVIHALVKQMEKVTKLVVVYQQLALVNSYWKWIRCVPVLCAANSGCVVNIWVSSWWNVFYFSDCFYLYWKQMQIKVPLLHVTCSMHSLVCTASCMMANFVLYLVFFARRIALRTARYCVYLEVYFFLVSAPNSDTLHLLSTHHTCVCVHVCLCMAISWFLKLSSCGSISMQFDWDNWLLL